MNASYLKIPDEMVFYIESVVNLGLGMCMGCQKEYYKDIYYPSLVTCMHLFS